MTGLSGRNKAAEGETYISTSSLLAQQNVHQTVKEEVTVHQELGPFQEGPTDG